MNSPVNKSKVLIRRPFLAFTVLTQMEPSRNLVCECWVPVPSLKLKSMSFLNPGLKSKNLLLKNYYHLTLTYSNKVNFVNICKLMPWCVYSILKTCLTFRLNVMNLLVQFLKVFSYFTTFRPTLYISTPALKKFPTSPNLL